MVSRKSAGCLVMGRILSVSFAILYAAVLTGLPFYQFPDRYNYIQYAERSSSIFWGYLGEGSLSLLVNEPIWLLVNSVLANFLEPEQIVRTIIFVSAATVAYVVLRSKPRDYIWLIVILLLPQVVKNHVTQLRQGLGLSFFLLGYFAVSRPARISMMGVAPFVHSSFFLVLGLYWITILMRKLRFAWDLRIATLVIIGIVFGAGAAWLALKVGARQVQHFSGFEIVRGPGVGWLFWATIAFFMAASGKSFLIKRSFGVAAVFFYVVSYFFFPWAARVFESMIIVASLAALNMPLPQRQIFCFGLFIYLGIGWGSIFMMGSKIFGNGGFWGG